MPHSRFIKQRDILVLEGPLGMMTLLLLDISSDYVHL